MCQCIGLPAAIRHWHIHNRHTHTHMQTGCCVQISTYRTENNDYGLQWNAGEEEQCIGHTPNRNTPTTHTTVVWVKCSSCAIGEWQCAFIQLYHWFAVFIVVSTGSDVNVTLHHKSTAQTFKIDSTNIFVARVAYIWYVRASKTELFGIIINMRCWESERENAWNRKPTIFSENLNKFG